jgi:hypothetical protein
MPFAYVLNSVQTFICQCRIFFLSIPATVLFSMLRCAAIILLCCLLAAINFIALPHVVTFLVLPRAANFLMLSRIANSFILPLGSDCFSYFLFFVLSQAAMFLL